MTLRLYIITITAIVIVISSCKTKTVNTVEPAPTFVDLIPDTLVYNVINYLISHEHLNPNLKSSYILEREDMPFLFYFEHDSLTLTELDTLFTENDIKCIFSQKNQFNNFKIDSSRVKQKTIVSYSTFENRGLKTFSTVSFPLFNKDRTIFIVRTGYYCGALCATHGTYIYKKKDSSWILIKSMNETVS